MARYISPEGFVEAVQWTGQALPDATIEHKSWGAVAVVKTADGFAWMTPGDWLIHTVSGPIIVSPSIFARDYTAASK